MMFNIVKSMKHKTLFILILLLLFCLNLFSQTLKTVHLADSLLKAGNFKVAITSYDFPNDIKLLQQKAVSNLKNNPEWADKYVVIQVEKGFTDVPNDLLDAYGLKEDEFEKMIEGFKRGKIPTYLDTINLTITKINGSIKFKTSGKLSLLNDITIDTKKNTITFQNLQARSERATDGIFWDPIIRGYETHEQIQIASVKNKSGIKQFGFVIGVDNGYSQTVVCLIYLMTAAQQVSMNDLKYVIISLL